MLVISTLFIFCSCNNISNLIYKSTSEDYGDTGGLQLPIDVNNTTISIMLSSEVSDLGNKIVIRELSERTGININIINIPQSEMAQETKVLLSTNELPDILSQTMTLDEINTLGEKGTFVPINKYLNELPNFKKVFVENKEYSSVFDLFTAADNNLYVFPGYESQRMAENVMLYRKDIFDKNNIRMWNNKEGFYKALKTLKEIYPESIPFTTRRGSKLYEDWSLSFGIDFPGVCYDNVKNEWIYSSIDPRFKEMLDYIRKLYDEELIDADFLTISKDAWNAKITSDNRSFVTFDSLDCIDIFNEKAKNPEYDLRYANPIGKGASLKGIEKIQKGPCISNNQNKLVSLKLLDYLLSPSGIELMTLGIKNKTYIYDSDNNIKYLSVSADKNASVEALEERYGLFVEGLYRCADKKSARYLYSPKEQEAIDKIAVENRIKEDYPYVKLTREERTIISGIEENLNQKAIAFASEYILTSNTGDEAFEKWIKDAKSLGVDTILNIYNGKK